MNQFLSISFFLCITNALYSQETVNNHLLNAPDDWRKEQLALPPRFAPEINAKGFEYVRFSKGWGDINSEEFWTFTFAWYLDENINVSETQLSNDLKAYFNGLFQLVGNGKGISNETVTNTTDISFKYDKSINTFIGNAKLFDVFFSEKPILLNIKASTETCKSNAKQIVYFRFSLKEFGHDLWKTMNDIRISCQ